MRYLRFLIPALLLSACVTVRQYPIETLQPARLTYDGPKNSIAICAPQTLFSEAIRSNESAIGIPSDSLIANVLFSLQRQWEEAPGYENTQFYVHIVTADEDFDTSDFDLVLWLERLQISNTYYGQQYSFFEWGAYLYVQYMARWVARSNSGTMIDEFTDRDLMIWSSGIREDKSDAVANLPDIKDAWWDLGIAMSQKYIARIAPQWQSGTRSIYMINKFSELSTQAYTAMQNNAYARAFDIWENMLLSCRKKGQKRIKSQITFNMAVACEFQNQLDRAIYWAQRSANLNNQSQTVRYLVLLRQREQHHATLDLQMLN